ncbi:MAG: arginine--tRNA ligase, partial [Planctomycetes bacterium]|nr:arginine--tRNA ligase [Planctomycetota bacterium]
SVRPAGESKHGDYQANAAMALAKAAGKPPRAVAELLVAGLEHGAAFSTPEIAGPGFLNFRFSEEWLADRLSEMSRDERLLVAPVGSPRRLVIDFSSPNVAKPMHVGHLRSTILGDALSRLFRFLGHEVITDNHLGDWGTQFGMLLYGYKNMRDDEAFRLDPVRELARLYVAVRQQFRADEDDDQASDPVQDACRAEVAKLHAGDPENMELWRSFMPACLEEIDRVYRRLDVRFDHVLGESFYQPMLATVAAGLSSSGIAEESHGAQVVFFGENEPPALVRKRDGAFTYATSDLAAIAWRLEKFNPTDILYVVDSRQALHFKQIFEVARRWGKTSARLTHVAFGSVLGEDRKPIKTRDGKAGATLEQLLDEAVRLAGETFDSHGDEDDASIPGADRAAIAEAVGIGAVKYADLSQNRVSDYVFSWDKMLAMDGNTAAYMQYAYARCRSILRKAGVSTESLSRSVPKVLIGQPAERALAIHLLRLGEALHAAAADFRPHVLTAYLWDLSKAYSAFFQSCPVLKAPDPLSRDSRLVLCDLVSRTIRTVLGLLGIRVVERM